MLEVEALAKAWPDFELEAGFRLRDGEIAALLGPSGCGKSTLLRLLAGLERPDRGSIRLDGRELSGLPPEKRGVGLVFQDFALFPGMSVARNIEYGPRRAGLARADRARLVASLAASMEIGGLLGRNPASLSGGEQQRVALARTLAASPRLVLLDEPLSSLDASLRRRLRVGIAERLRAASVMALHVTHDVEEALAVADRIFLMGRGRIVEEGSPEELYARPATAYGARFLGRGPVIRPSSVEAIGAAYKARCGFGDFLCAGPAEGAAACSLFFPAEAPRFVGLETGGDNVARATVLGSVFGGRFRRISLACEPGPTPALPAEASRARGGPARLEIELEAPVGLRPRVGERVAFRVAPEDCILLPETP
ncbi:MAG TPA: ABC transporter ATP-binding protein [Spirochaetales bacterium]|nr:ABC transporter ATP-binding protein [Spirochaetales bacterium]HRY54342.1 ABC transporter ATP-binding protein [Spirochaetia bacterium]HRZ65703.1 ABC transporter ATP-binding protein [Spirochaetia bacterium]